MRYTTRYLHAGSLKLVQVISSFISIAGEKANAILLIRHKLVGLDLLQVYDSTRESRKPRFPLQT